MNYSIYLPPRRLVKTLVLFSFFFPCVISFGQERAWTDLTGKYQTVAELLKLDKKSVILRKQNGVVIRVPLNKLCNDDLNYLDELQAGKANDDRSAKPVKTPAARVSILSTSTPATSGPVPSVIDPATTLNEPAATLDPADALAEPAATLNPTDALAEPAATLNPTDALAEPAHRLPESEAADGALMPGTDSSVPSIGKSASDTSVAADSVGAHSVGAHSVAADSVAAAVPPIDIAVGDARTSVPDNDTFVPIDTSSELDASSTVSKTVGLDPNSAVTGPAANASDSDFSVSDSDFNALVPDFSVSASGASFSAPETSNPAHSVGDLPFKEPSSANASAFEEAELVAASTESRIVDNPRVRIENVEKIGVEAGPVGSNAKLELASDRLTNLPLPTEMRLSLPKAVSAGNFNVVELTETQQASLVENGIHIPLAEQDFATVRQTLKQLKKGWPSKPLPELILNLEECTRSSEKMIRLPALELLAVHDSEGSFEQIVLATFDSNFDVRWLAYDTLGEMADNRGLKSLVNRFSGPDSSKVATVLESFGETAEPDVLVFLKSDDKNLRLSTCSLLAKIGTEKSIDELKKLADTDAELSVRYQAKNALSKIRLRSQPQSTE